MELVLASLCLMLIFIHMYQIARHGLHMVQLENYYLDRYAVWMKRNIRRVLSIKTIFVLCIGIALFVLSMWKSDIEALKYVSYGYEILAILFLILSFKKTKEKKAFVVTSRIIRVYITYMILFIIAGVLTIGLNIKIGLCVLNVCVVLGYVWV